MSIWEEGCRLSQELATRPVVIGTAGHVDHGKTTLVKALTGVDTDRLKEEKQRGISIDLGFAEFRLPGGRSAAIIDVPGHERFIHNMVAGVHGIDLVLLVVAADEGVMPQTTEHLDILQLLGIQRGLVALTKVDLVRDEEWLELVEEDVRSALAGTFLAGAPIVRVSPVTGEGLDRLVQAIVDLMPALPPRDLDGLPRLPIDRVFTVSGFGTVVTGTLVAGTLEVDQRLVVEPGGQEVRVRHLQVHGREVPRALAGQRVAANLAGIDHRQLHRGQVLLPPGTLRAERLFACRVQWLPGAGKPLRHDQRLRFHTGASEVIGRVTLLGPGEEIAPGTTGWILFRAEQPVVAAPGDRFVLRSYSPMRTVGGGVVADAGRRWRRRDAGAIPLLESFLDSDPAQVVDARLRQAAGPVELGELVRQTGRSPVQLLSQLERLGREGRVRAAGEGAWIATGVFDSLRQRAREALVSFHERHPVQPGMTREELRQAVLPGHDSRRFNALLGEWAAEGQVEVRGEWVCLPGWRPQANRQVAAKMQRLARVYEQAGLAPPADPGAAAEVAAVPREEVVHLLGLLEEEGSLVRVDEELWFARAAVMDALERLRRLQATTGPFTVAQARDALGTTRRYVVPLLEFFDRQHWTRREGDLRRVLPGPRNEQAGSG